MNVHALGGAILFFVAAHFFARMYLDRSTEEFAFYFWPALAALGVYLMLNV